MRPHEVTKTRSPGSQLARDPPIVENRPPRKSLPPYGRHKIGKQFETDVAPLVRKSHSKSLLVTASESWSVLQLEAPMFSLGHAVDSCKKEKKTIAGGQ